LARRIVLQDEDVYEIPLMTNLDRSRRTAIEGILPVIPTPLRDGEFDAESFGRLLDHILPHVDGYTLLGSTGEAPSLAAAERMEIAAAALAATPDDKTVVVGVSHTALEEAQQLAAHAERHGAAAVLFTAPYYFRNTVEGLGAHLAELASAIDIELVFYDNPAPSGTPVTAEQIIRYVAQIEQLNTVKLTDHAIEKVAAWQACGLRVLGGDDPILFRFLAAGVDGVMVIAPAVFPAAFGEVWRRFRSGDVLGALDVFSAEILPFLHVFGIGDEVATTKALLAGLGVFESDELRPPLTAVDPHRRDLLMHAYRLCEARTETRYGVVSGAVDGSIR
jgi:4-hydroxy-tetrahydrodipicolinate synthase